MTREATIDEAVMTENEALDHIERLCRSKDFESNGVHLDRIIGEFLRSNGFGRLADRADDVDCWRA